MAFKIFTNSMNTSDMTLTGATAYEFNDTGQLVVTFTGGKTVTYSPHAWHRVEETT